MTPESFIRSEIERKGMSIKVVSDRSNVKYSCLQPSLQERRQLRADEYLRLCEVLEIDPRSYQSA